jgi:hypothetical protein
MKKIIALSAIAIATTIASAADVNPGIIFGSGNANGSWTVSESSNVELGLRAKLRYNSSGSPENTFNWDGVDTYTFDPDNSANPSNRSIFNFEFSINSDVNDATSSGNNLNDFTYLLTVSRLNDDGMGVTVLASFDPINLPYWDSSIGDNGTTAATDTVATDAMHYASLIANNNVAQQSANLGFGYTDQPTRAGTYYMSLTAFDGMTTVTSTDITVNVVPVPTAAFAGLGLLGSLAGIRAIRRR